ncbi:AprI/Inh family metalloprotease inhibitor [Methylocella sp.]|uniref:AprI/Inh family metalloprotease inhibitor n=1 Tax=Methylocella sp. TaxID=1978226 RepID=UPI0037836FAA
MRRLRPSSLASARFLVLAAALAAPGAAGAAGLDKPLDKPEAAIGQWDMTLEGGSRECRLALRPERQLNGFYIGLPHGCRRAIASLVNAAAWNISAPDHIAITDVRGASLLDFAREPDGTLTAATPSGEIYRLTFVGPLPLGSLTASAAPAVAAAPQAGGARPAPQAAPGRPADVTGRYAVLRDGGRDTGCMVTLDPGGRAYLAPACRDQGIVTFDPVGWRLASSRLVLTARKGHTTTLDQQPDGTWMKDAALGKTLGLKRL